MQDVDTVDGVLIVDFGRGAIVVSPDEVTQESGDWLDL